jgi:hypothetical protein
LEVQDAAAQLRQAQWEREKQERELKEAAVQAERERVAADRDLAQQYRECFGRPLGRDIALMSDKDKANLFILMNPEVLKNPHPSPCRK